MGSEAKCTASFRGKTAAGTARLETEVLQFRGGDLRLSIPFESMSKVVADGDMLTVSSKEGVASFDLGASASKWAEKIRNPPSRMQKLGVKPDWRASALGVEDEAFLAELEGAIARVSIGRLIKECDAVFYGVTKADQLHRLEALKGSIKPNGAVWVIRPKGRPEISEGAVMTAGKAAGLVDVKVVSFSSTHTAEKFVIPVKRR